jgi:hypothetical protein
MPGAAGMKAVNSLLSKIGSRKSSDWSKIV